MHTQLTPTLKSVYTVCVYTHIYKYIYIDKSSVALSRVSTGGSRGYDILPMMAGMLPSLWMTVENTSQITNNNASLWTNTSTMSNIHPWIYRHTQGGKKESKKEWAFSISITPGKCGFCARRIPERSTQQHLRAKASEGTLLIFFLLPCVWHMKDKEGLTPHLRPLSLATFKCNWSTLHMEYPSRWSNIITI